MANALSMAAVELRKKLSVPINQSELARRLGVTKQAVTAWLTGVAKPEPERMAEIETLLGIPMRAWVVAAAANEAAPDEDDEAT